jgi:hypothetical protein
MLEMNPEIRAKWTAALRSGEYEQGQNALRCGGKRCCLGVEAGVTEGYPGEDGLPWTYDGVPDYLPEAVQEWAGLPVGSPELLVTVYAGDVPELEGLAILNDDYNWDFGRIADAIDSGAS